MITKKEPLVSVVIAFMNEEAFLEEAITSVLKQDYDNYELLLIDDGSADSTTQIAKGFAAAYPEKVFYFDHENHQNKGVCVSRNLGVEKSKGELIALLDADDVWLPGKLFNQVAIFANNPGIGMVAEASLYWASWNQQQAKDVTIAVGANPGKVYSPPALMFILYPLKTGAAPCPSALMLTKAAIIKAGGFEKSFIKKFQLYEDQAFLCKIYLQQAVFVSSACNNLYRQREESVVKWVNNGGHYHKVRRYFLDWLQAYLKKENIKNKQLNKLMDRSFLRYRYPQVFFLTNTVPAMVLSVYKKTFPKGIKKYFK